MEEPKQLIIRRNLMPIQKLNQNLLIAQHPDEIHHFVRIPYTVPLTTGLITEFLQQHNIPIGHLT